MPATERRAAIQRDQLQESERYIFSARCASNGISSFLLVFPLNVCMFSVTARRLCISVSAARQFSQWRGRAEDRKERNAGGKKRLQISKSRYKGHCLHTRDLALIKIRSCYLKQTIHLPSALQTAAKASRADAVTRRANV